MKKFVTALPPDASEKEQFYAAHASSADQQVLLQDYIALFIKKNHLEKFEFRKKTRIKMIVAAALSLVIALEIIYLMLYHARGMILLIAAELIVLIIVSLKGSISGDLFREVIRRPEDNIDNILVSQVSGTKDRRLTRLLMFVPLLVIAAATVIVFWKPHMIFEKTESRSYYGLTPVVTGEPTKYYSLRYYTLSFHPEERVVIPKTYKGGTVTEIRGEVFTKMHRLHYVVLPSGISEIRGSTFEECTGLREIDIPKGVMRIGGHAFYGCKNLSRVTVPSTVTEIGSSAFRRCSSLLEIKIPEGASVNEKAFKESPTKVIRY